MRSLNFGRVIYALPFDPTITNLESTFDFTMAFASDGVLRRTHRAIESLEHGYPTLPLCLGFNYSYHIVNYAIVLHIANNAASKRPSTRNPLQHIFQLHRET